MSKQAKQDPKQASLQLKQAFDSKNSEKLIEIISAKNFSQIEQTYLQQYKSEPILEQLQK